MLDLVDQVARHGGLQRLAPDDDVDAGAGAAQEHRRLPGGVAAAHNGDRVSVAGLGFHLGGRVVDADALELGQPGQRQPVVARPGRDDDRLRGDRVTIVEPDPVQAACEDSDTALAACLMRTPNFWACKAARVASSSPDKPAGKPSRFSIRDEVPAWPPSAVSSARTVAIPSDAPYTAAARPPGPAPTTSRSHTPGRSVSPGPDKPSASSSSRLPGPRCAHR